MLTEISWNGLIELYIQFEIVSRLKFFISNIIMMTVLEFWKRPLANMNISTNKT